MKKVVQMLALVSLVISTSVFSQDWTQRQKQKLRHLGQKIGVVEETPLEKMQRGAQKMGEGVVAGWEKFKRDFPKQVEIMREEYWKPLKQKVGETAEEFKRRFEKAQRKFKKQWKLPQAPWETSKSK